MDQGQVKITIARQDPAEGTEVRWQEYAIACAEPASLLHILNKIYETKDSSLSFRRYCCGTDQCSSCMMTVDGHARKACVTLLKPGQSARVEPLFGYKIIKDLVVDFSEKL